MSGREVQRPHLASGLVPESALGKGWEWPGADPESVQSQRGHSPAPLPPQAEGMLRPELLKAGITVRPGGAFSFLPLWKR